MPPEHTVHPWLAHLQGLTALIKARSERTDLSLVGEGFYATPESSPQGSPPAVDSETSISEWVIGKSDLSIKPIDGKALRVRVSRDSHHARQGVVTSLDEMILQTMPTFEIAPSFLESSGPSSRANVERLLAIARSQLQSLKEWSSTMPENWKSRTISADHVDSFEVSQLDIFPGRVDVYTSCQYELVHLKSEFG